MKLSNADIRASAQALNTLAQRKLPVSASFVVSRNLKVLQPVLEDIEQQRQDILKEYATTDDKGELVKGKDGEAQFENGRDDFMEAFVELLETETEVSVTKLKLSAFRDAEIEPALLFNLDWMIEA